MITKIKIYFFLIPSILFLIAGCNNQTNTDNPPNSDWKPKSDFWIKSTSELPSPAPNYEYYRTVREVDDNSKKLNLTFDPIYDGHDDYNSHIFSWVDEKYFFFYNVFKKYSFRIRFANNLFRQFINRYAWIDNVAYFLAIFDGNNNNVDKLYNIENL